MDKLPEPRVEKLKGDLNWQMWKFDVISLLKALKLEQLLYNKQEQPNEKDDVVKYIIGSSLSAEPKQHVITCNTANEMWEKLVCIYEQKNERRLELLYVKFCTYSKNPSDSVATHASKLQTLFRDLNEELKEENCVLPQSLLLNRILYTLPEEYAVIQSSWEGVPKKERNVTYLVERLRLQEQRLQESHQPQAYASFKISKQSKPCKSNNEKKVTKCTICNKMGHSNNFCWFKKQCNKQNSKKDDDCKKGNASFCAYEASESINFKKNDFYIDSGASQHLCSNKSLFKKITPCKSNIKIADGSEKECIGKGVISLIENINNVNINIDNVAFVPGLSVNLLSVSKIVDKGYLVCFDKKGCKIYEKGSCLLRGSPTVIAERCNNLFKIKSTDTSESKVSINDDNHDQHLNGEYYFTNKISKESQKLWHGRLGHLNHFCMRILTKLATDVKYNLEERDLCEVCVLSKMTRKSFPKAPFSFKRSNGILELIHTDVCSFPTPTINGEKYFVSFIDDFSRKSFVVILKAKSEVFEAFKMFKSFVERQTNKKVKSLLSDNGGEYLSNNFKKYLADLGIKHITTVPYTPQQNGIAERFNRIVCDKTRCLLTHANLPPELWGEALKTAVYLKNCSPTKAIKNAVPLQVWNGGKSLSLKHLRIFGCTAYAHVNTPSNSKLSPRAKKYIFVGYNANSYRLMSVDDPSVIISARDVIFNEKEFPGLNITHLDNPDNDIAVINLNIPKKSGIEINLDKTLNADTNVTADSPSNDYLPLESSELLGLCSRMSEVSVSTPTNESFTPTESTLTNFSLSNLTVPTDDDSFQSCIDGEATQRAHLPRSAKEATDYSKFFCVTDTAVNIPVPESYDDAINGVYGKEWLEAINDELASIKKNNTWTLVEKPVNVKLIGAKWVFAIKNLNGGPKFKARLVAQGFSEVEGVHYDETFSPVIRYSSLRMLLAFSVENDLKIRHLDVKTAFLNAELKEDIYLRPKNIDTQGKVCKLNKALYGLKQSSRCWYQKINNVLVSDLGFKASSYEPCIFIKKNNGHLIIIALWVDDIFIISKEKDLCDHLVNLLSSKFEMCDLGEVENILGMQIKRNTNSLELCNRTYIQNLLKKYKMDNAAGADTPMEHRLCFDSNSKSFEGPYRQLIGSLMYLVVTCRPDIAFPVTFLSQFNNNPKVDHWKAAQRILKYLNRTLDYKLCFHKTENPLFGYSDSDWGNNADRKSFGGFIFILAGGAISWSCKKQNVVATSSTEAEYIALTEAAKEGIFLRNLLAEIDDNILKSFCIFSDSQSAIAISMNPRITSKSKHISIKEHFIRQQVEEGNVSLSYVSTQHMVADFLTKSLPVKQHQLFCEAVGLDV